MQYLETKLDDLEQYSRSNCLVVHGTGILSFNNHSVFVNNVVDKLNTALQMTEKLSPNDVDQRWSPRGRPWPRGRPRGQILKSLALALASRPQVLENWPVLGSRTALFFGKLKFCGAVEKFFGKRFFVEIA